MSADSKPGADRMARSAGMWRPIEMSDGDILKLFQSGKQGEKNYRQFDGKWYVLDESPEAIAEAKQSVDDDERVKIAIQKMAQAQGQPKIGMALHNRVIELMDENELLKKELNDLKENQYLPRRKQ